MNEVTAKFIDENIPTALVGTNPTVKHRFFGGATCKGAVDYVPELIELVGKRFFIKGRPGSGKSTMMKKIVAAAEQKGYDVDVYHCGFDAQSLDMVMVRELDWGIFDSTAPHEYFPSCEKEHVIDV